MKNRLVLQTLKTERWCTGSVLFSMLIVLLTSLYSSHAQAVITMRSSAQNGIATATPVGVNYVGVGGLRTRTSCGNINPPVPAGNVDDLLIALAMDKDDDGNAITMSGWNTYYAADYPGNPPDHSEMQVRIFWRIATGGDPNTISKTGSACTNLAGRISRFSGVDTVSPFETPGPGVSTQNTNYMDTGSITTTSPMAMLLVAGFISDDNNVTQGAGWSQSFDSTSGGAGQKPDLGMTLNYQAQTTAGLKSESNWMLTGNADENFGVIFALTPGTGGGGGGLSINVPAGSATDDVMVAAIAVRPSTVSIIPPAGWTSLIRTNQTSGNSNAQEIFYRIAGASEPASYEWNFATTITGAAGGIVSYTGAHPTNPINVFAGNTTANGTSHQANSITTTQASTMVISTHSFSSARTWTPPTGMTEDVDVASIATPNAAGIALEMNHVPQPAAGATGNKVATVGGSSDTGVAQLLALQETFVPVVQVCDDFESGFNWTPGGTANAVGVSGATFSSASNSMFLRWNTATSTSPVTDFSVTTQLTLTAWIRRGSDAFSEDPDNGEHLVFEYLNNLSVWVPLETYPGGGTQGEIFNRNYTMNADALHANFQVRFRFLTGNGSDWDYWHVDDVCYVTPAASTDHFEIIHDTTAINCQAEPITIEAHQSDHSVDTSYTGTLNLSTSSGNGDWTVITGGGALNNGAADDGAATYDMVVGDNGVVVLGLKDAAVESVNINVSDGFISEVTGTALASEDQNLAFAESGFVFLADGVASNVGTQIGGKLSSLAPGAQVLELQAIRTSDTTGACEAALQGVNQIELAYECRNPMTCTANQVNIDGGIPTSIAGNPLGPIGSYSLVNLDFGNATDTTASFVMDYPDVGEIQLFARYNIPLDDGSGTPSGVYMAGGSNAFVVRPFGFSLSVAGNPAANAPAGAQFAVAGVDFNVSSTAVLYQASDDTNNDGIPDNHDDTDPSNNADLSNNNAALNYGQEITTENLTLLALLNQPGGGNDPGLKGVTAITSFINGTGSTTAARYDEVGIIEITANVTDGNYLGIGIPSTAGLLGKSGYVGRFYPNNFVLNNLLVTNRSALACAPASNFTYMGENYTIDFDLEVWSADPTGADVPIKTENYVAGFTKLNPTVITEMNYGATDSSVDLTARLNVGSAGAFVGGVALVQATLSLGRNAIPDGQYASFEVGLSPDDGDTVPVKLLPAALDLSLNGGPNTHRLLGQTDIRYGRLNLQNNFGSELLMLTMPLSAEYYLNTTAEFITNIDDSCTTRTAADILLYNDQEAKTGRLLGDPVINVNGASSTTLTGVSAFVAGQSVLTFTAPGAEGYVDVEVQTPNWLKSDLDAIDQGIQGPGMHCNPALVVSDPAYIAGCVADGNIVDEIPLSRGNFGLFKGSDNIIYIREIY